jgi:cytoskeleton protein RodZ
MTEADAAATPTAGALLRAARERQGLHIAALAAAIKVTPRKLDALENDRWNELPDATFTRALAQTVCRSLKIDPRPVLELLPPAESMGLERSGGSINEPFDQGRGGDGGGWVGAAIRPLVAAALLLLVAAAVIYLVPADWWSGDRDAAPAVVVVPQPAQPAASDAAASAPAGGASAAAAGGTGEPARGETVFATPGGTAAAPMDGAAGPAAAGAATGGAAGGAGTAPGPGAAPSGILQVRASDASWIEVRDAEGRLLLSRTVLPGEAVGLDGAPPLRLVVGNAPATTLTFRGREVDLAPHTRDTVARLELR